MLKIESLKNPQVKNWKKLHTSKGRDKSGQYIVEGEHLVEEVLSSQEKVLYLLISNRYLQSPLLNQIKKGTDVVYLSSEIVAVLSQTQSPQGIFAVIERKERSFMEKLDGNILLIDGVQDPGNLGTMIRTADAAGYQAVILGEGTVDLLNDKVIRSSQGSLWHLPIIKGNLNEWIPRLQASNYQVLATSLNQEAIPYDQIRSSQKTAIIVGNEGRGVHSTWIQMADKSVYIPMPGKAESLNVAVATGILLFQFMKKDDKS